MLAVCLNFFFSFMKLSGRQAALSGGAVSSRHYMAGAVSVDEFLQDYVV